MLEGSMQQNFQKLQGAGYDSLHLTGFNSGDEWVVYNKDQVELVDVAHMHSTCTIL